MLFLNGKDSSQQLKVVCDVFKNDLNPTNLQVQLEQFANLFQDKSNCSIDMLVEVLSTFGKNLTSDNVVTRCCETSKTFPSHAGYKCLC